MKPVALDIETSGIDPDTSEVIGIGIAGGDGPESLLGVPEIEMLHWVEAQIEQSPVDSQIITWNGSEFDLPFLAYRFRARGLRTSLRVRRTGEVGKYGKPLHDCTWGEHQHLDLAYVYKSRAELLGVEWALKPVAKAVLAVDPIVVDNAGASIASMDRELLTDYLTSDIEITLALAHHLPSKCLNDVTRQGFPQSCK